MREKKNGTGNYPHGVTVRLSTPLNDLTDTIAKNRGAERSTMLREWIEDYMVIKGEVLLQKEPSVKELLAEVVLVLGTLINVMNKATDPEEEARAIIESSKLKEYLS